MSEILRLIAGGLLALIACYVGLLIKRKYKSRAEYYKSACEFAKCVTTELSMKKTPMPDVAENFLKGRNGDFEKTVETWLDLARKGQTFAYENASVSFLNNDEKKPIADFFSALGKTALNDQLSHIGYYENVFESKKSKCEDESKKLGGMYFKLCVLSGIAIMLILA